jgi:hypothetical protein
MEKTFADFDRDTEKYSDANDFERYKQGFVLLDNNARIETLKAWDDLFESEVRPTHALARRVTQKRELDDLHGLLKRSGR